jgi:hypothetical protein
MPHLGASIFFNLLGFSVAKRSLRQPTLGLVALRWSFAVQRQI